MQYREILGSTQSPFFDNEQFVLADGNSLFSVENFTTVSLVSDLLDIKSPVESIESSHHPRSVYLQMTDQIGLFDTRTSALNVIYKVPAMKVPSSRIYSLKHLEDNYFCAVTTNHIKLFDVRCTNYPVYTFAHGSDEAPPYVVTI